MSAPVLSIVVPVFNGKKYIQGCLDSVETAVNALSPAQRAQVEVIVCDNQSTDETLELSRQRKLDCAYEIIQTPVFYENRCYNWHHGLSHARGEWMMMLHVDDLLAPEGLVNILEAISQKSAAEASMISGRHRTLQEDGTKGELSPAWKWKALISGEALRQKVLFLMCPFVPFTVMRRAAYEKVGGLDRNYELLQDWDLWIRLLGVGQLFYWPKETGYWRIHGISETYAKVFAREHMILASKLEETVPGIGAAKVKASFYAQSAKAYRLVKPDVAHALHQEFQMKTAQESETAQILANLGKQVRIELLKLRMQGSARLMRP